VVKLVINTRHFDLKDASNMHAYSHNIVSCLLFLCAHLGEIVTRSKFQKNIQHVQYSAPMTCVKKNTKNITAHCRGGGGGGSYGIGHELNFANHIHVAL
jgi:hypothetical protein